MLIEFSPWVLVGINIVAWAVFHLGLAALATALPLRFFPPQGFICRERRGEKRGKLYERLFAVRRWKGLLPEGADIVGAGFKKGRLASRDPDYLREFYMETCRSEICHWWVWLAGWLFFLWNPPWAGWVMVIYATFANFPCIIAQRYNRARLADLPFVSDHRTLGITLRGQIKRKCQKHPKNFQPLEIDVQEGLP